MVNLGCNPICSNYGNSVLDHSNSSQVTNITKYTTARSVHVERFTDIFTSAHIINRFYFHCKFDNRKRESRKKTLGELNSMYRPLFLKLNSHTNLNPWSGRKLLRVKN